MTKMWYIILGLLTLSPGLFGMEQEEPIVEFGSFPARETVDEFTVMQDLQGGVYVLYIAGNQFSVIRGDRDGNFEPYTVPQLEPGFQNPRNLSVNPPGFTEYAAFMADKMGILYVYLFRIDHDGDLLCAAILEAGQSGLHAGFSLGESYAESCNVYITIEGVLSCFTGAGRHDRPPVRRALSLAGEKVDRYGVLRKPDTSEHYGWYSVFREADERNITLFLIHENGLVIREAIGVYTEKTEITGHITTQGEVQYTIIRDKGVRLFKETGAGFVPVAAFFVPVPVDAYISPGLSGFSFGIATGTEENKKQLYGIVNEDSDTPQITAWIEVTGTTAADFVSPDRKRCVGIFEKDGRLWSASIRVESTAVKPDGLAPVEWGRYLFVNQSTGRLWVYLVDDKRAALLIHTYDGFHWEKTADIALPEGIDPQTIRVEPGISDNPFLLYTNFIFLGAGNNCIAGDISGKTWNIIPGRQRTWGRMINGYVFLAVHDEDLLTVYRMKGPEL
jgi:hypothetical protein